MKLKTFSIATLLAGVLALSACGTTTNPVAATNVSAPVSSDSSVATQIAEASCVSPVERRDSWLRSQSPSVSEVREGYKAQGVDPDKSAVFNAYKAWKDAGENHDAAAAVYGEGYAEAAACWA